MGKLYTANKAQYAPIEKEDAKAPVLLTQLRKDAIRQVLVHNGMNENGADTNELVEAAFGIWVDARHQTIPSHFAESTVDILKEICSLRSRHDTNVVIGAITDGNSDPMLIPEISEFFDFCINAESVGISKPDKRVYLRGVARAIQHPTLQDLLPAASSIEDGELTEEALEDLIGPWWVHIGDDFVKDCVAAKNLNMRTIWATELVRDKIVKQETWKMAAESSKQKRTVEELVKEVSELEVVEMQVGADNYLANSLQAEFADAVADEFQSVACILRQWQEEAVSAGSAIASEGPPESGLSEYFELIKPDKETETVASADSAKAKDDSANDTKFCIYCGAKLPVVAKFCSSCGEKQ